MRTVKALFPLLFVTTFPTGLDVTREAAEVPTSIRETQDGDALVGDEFAAFIGSCRRSRASRERRHVMTDRFALAFHGVRYQVKDVSRAVAFYTRQLGFTLEHQQLPAFASVSIDGLQVLLSGPGASGSRPLPDGRHQVPGGWNRIVLRVADLPARVEALRNAGLHFPQRPGGGPWRPADPAGGSRRQSTGALRTGPVNPRPAWHREGGIR
jgi:glyoxylase I family protein